MVVSVGGEELEKEFWIVLVMGVDKVVLINMEDDIEDGD